MAAATLGGSLEVAGVAGANDHFSARRGADQLGHPGGMVTVVVVQLSDD